MRQSTGGKNGHISQPRRLFPVRFLGQLRRVPQRVHLGEHHVLRRFALRGRRPFNRAESPLEFEIGAAQVLMRELTAHGQDRQCLWASMRGTSHSAATSDYFLRRAGRWPFFFALFTW